MKDAKVPKIRTYKRGRRNWIEFHYKTDLRDQHRFPAGETDKEAAVAVAKATLALQEGRFDGTRESIFGEAKVDADGIRPISLDNLVRDWMRKKVTAAKGTQVLYGKLSTAILNHFGKDRVFHRIPEKDVAEFIQEKVASLKAGSAKNYLVILRQLYALAIQNRNAKADYTKGWKRMQGTSREFYLTRSEFERLLENAPDWLSPFLVAAAYTGGRKEEVLGLTWERVDLDAGLVTFPKTKNKKPRSVPISARLREVLLGMESRGLGGFVFRDPVRKVTVRRGRETVEEAARLDGVTAYLYFVKAARAAEIWRMVDTSSQPDGAEIDGEAAREYPHIHDLRHTAASWWIQNGVPLAVIQRLLGHSKIEMTLRYAHLQQADLAVAADVLDTLDRKWSAEQAKRKVPHTFPHNAAAVS